MMNSEQKSIVLILVMGIAASAGSLGDDKERGLVYSPVGKRDPFRPPSLKTMDRELAGLAPIERYTINQLQLKAVLTGLGKRRAMFQDPEGKTHIVIEGQTIARERVTVSRILKTEVILTQRTFNYLGQEKISERIIALEAAEDEVAGPTTATETETKPDRLPAEKNQSPQSEGSVKQEEKPKESPGKQGQNGNSIPPVLQASPAQEAVVQEAMRQISSTSVVPPSTASNKNESESEENPDDTLIRGDSQPEPANN